MNCDRVREVAPLWLSAELDGVSHAAIAEHLEACSACARLLADQAFLDSRIRVAFESEGPDMAFPTAFETNSAVRQHIARERSRRRWLVAGAAVAAVLLAAVLTREWPKPDRLYADAARDHRMEVLERQPRRWRTTAEDVGKLAARFGLTEETAFKLAPAGFQLSRAKTCGLEGRPALHLVYGDGAREISVYLRKTAGGLPRAGTAQMQGERLASANNTRYAAVVVANTNLDECRQIARHIVELL